MLVFICGGLFLFFFILKQHSYRGRIGIIILAALHTPIENEQEDDCYRETDQYEQNNNRHKAYTNCLLRCFLAAVFTATVVNTTTQILLSGMRIAAINGVRCPVTAKLKAMAL